MNSVGSFKLILTLSVPQKLKNFIFEIPIIPQILSINNWRTKVQDLSTYEPITLTVFEILWFESRPVL